MPESPQLSGARSTQLPRAHHVTLQDHLLPVSWTFCQKTLPLGLCEAAPQGPRGTE